MQDSSSELDDAELAYHVRRRLSIIQSHATLLADRTFAESPIDRDDVSEVRYDSPINECESLERIQRACYEIDGWIERRVPDESEVSEPIPATDAPNTTDRILICTRNEYLVDAVEAYPDGRGNVDLTVVDDPGEIRNALADESFDCLLVDAVWPNLTGTDLVGELAESREEVVPFALLSLYSDGTTPVGLGVSGVLSPTASSDAIETAIGSIVDDPETAEIVGFFEEPPDGALVFEEPPDGALNEWLTRFDSDLPNLDADVVCLDVEVYRRLSPRALGRLREVGPGRGRPVVLVGSTAADPYDRSWIPTVGGTQFLHRPPDLLGLLTPLLVGRSKVRPVP